MFGEVEGAECDGAVAGQGWRPDFRRECDEFLCGLPKGNFLILLFT